MQTEKYQIKRKEILKIVIEKYGLKSLISSFDMSCVEESIISQIMVIKGFHLVDYKIRLLKILKEIVVVLAVLNDSLAFQICDKLKCDTIRCDVFDKLLIISKESQILLERYMDFCLKTGLNDKFIQLCDKYILKAKDSSKKEKYNTIKYKLLQNRQPMVNNNIFFNPYIFPYLLHNIVEPNYKIKTVYDIVKTISIADLQAVYKEIKSIWQSLQQKKQ